MDNSCARLFAISDFHLSINNPKPMNIFGTAWDNHFDKINEYWRENITENDIVLIAGDISWAMYLEDARADLELIGGLPGKKVLLRGNHDYWWKSISAVRGALPENMYAVQNDALKLDGYVICGTRCWTVPEVKGAFASKEDEKIYLREAERLKLSFASAERLRKDGDKLVCMTHYPPFNVRSEDSDYTAIIEANAADACVYGHLHGKKARNESVLTKRGIPYYLTSCDLVDNKAVRIF